MAGTLRLHWIVDGLYDGTPPGGALLFELWHSESDGYKVRLYYTAQTLDQMRKAQKLTAANPAERAPVFVPGCSGSDMACSLADFSRVVSQSINPPSTTDPQ